MPFVSEMQRRKFYATPALHQYIPEFEATTPHSLPLRVTAPSHPDKRTNAKARHDNVTQMLAQVRP